MDKETILEDLKETMKNSDSLNILSGSHSDWQKEMKLTLKIATLTKQLLDLIGQDETRLAIGLIKKDLELEKMITIYGRYIEWLDIRRVHQNMAEMFPGRWEEVRDQIVQELSPEFFAQEYAEAAIADSKLQEVFYEQY